VNVFVFDSHAETCQLWQELASSHGYRISIFHNPDRLAGVIAEAQIIIFDQSLAPHAFLSTITSICKQNPSAQVIATAANIRVDEAVDLMRDGATLVLAKPLSRSRLQSVLPQVLAQVAQITSLKQEYQQLHTMFSKLTTREKDVLNYILGGTSNKDTAAILCVSVRTIESRRAKVYRKLEANNVAELVRKIDRLEMLGKQCAAQPAPKARLEPATHTHTDLRSLTGMSHKPNSHLTKPASCCPN
jgi:FixJ family two-component response regulator